MRLWIIFLRRHMRFGSDCQLCAAVGPVFYVNGIEPEWVYYCVCQETNLANQFIAQLSTGFVDPFWENNAGGGFISGDPFIVYPAPGGHVWESLRHHTSLNGEWRFRLHPTAQIDESREWETITLPCHWASRYRATGCLVPNVATREIQVSWAESIDDISVEGVESLPST